MKKIIIHYKRTPAPVDTGGKNLRVIRFQVDIP